MHEGGGSIDAGGSSPVLLTENLHKSYGSTPALRGLSFALNSGRVLGFLGPNGAGKTTAIRILTTILEPSAGHFFIDGTGSEYPEKIRRKIGVLPESLGFPKQVTGIEFLTYFGRLYGLTSRSAGMLAFDILKEVGLEKRRKTLIGNYSRGMRQRLGIARALINDPVVIFLDEPTLGLDPHGQRELLLLIRRIARQHHKGAILCSHFLSEIEGFCDDVIILNMGQVVAMGSVSEVIGHARQKAIRCDIVRIQVAAECVRLAEQTLAAIPGVRKISVKPEMAGWLELELSHTNEDEQTDKKQVNNYMLNKLIQAGIHVLGFEKRGSRLQDVFFQLTDEENQ